MADSTSSTNSDDSIRVQLSLLSAQDSAAATQLANSLQQIATMFQALKASDFRDLAAKMASLHTQMVADTQKLQLQAEQIQQRGGAAPASIIDRLTAQGGQVLSPAQAASDTAQVAEQQRRTKADSDGEQARQKERDRLDSLSSDQHAADLKRRQAKLPGIGQTDDEGNNLDDPTAWYNKVDSLKGEPTGFRIPRFGQLNVQDYINMARDTAEKGGLNNGVQIGKFQMGQETSQSVAQGLQTLSNRAGYAYAGRDAFRRVSNFASAQGFNPGDMANTGAQLGYRRDTGGLMSHFNIPGTGIGFATPFSSAGGEGLRQAEDTQMLRLRSGINGEQAKRIVNASAAAGFSGDQGGDVANNLMAPLFQRFGLDPQSLIPFTQVLRTGTGTVQDLSKELGNLGEGARTARMDINTYTQAVAASGEAAQSSGGSYMQGIKFGQDFGLSTGLDPSVGNQLLSNPLIQANLAGMTGLPSFAQGAASPLVKEQAIQASLRQMVSGFKGSMPTTRVAIRDPATGKIIDHETTSGLDAAIGAAASQLGINFDEAKKLLNDHGAVARQNLNAEIRNYGTERTGKDGHMVHIGDRYQQVGRGVVRIPGHDVMMGGVGLNDQRWSNIEKLAKEAGVSSSDIKSASGQKTRAKRIQSIQKAISEKQIQAQADTHIAFTGPAEKFFKALVNKNGGWNQFGGDSTATSASTAASSAGSSPLSDLTNTGLNGP